MNPAAITQNQVAGFLRKRPRDSHKGMFGTIAVIGGASGMTGAALLAARAALKLGAGCVHVGLLAGNAPVVDFLQPELMLHPALSLLFSHPEHPQAPRPHADRRVTDVRSLLDLDVLLVGCGMGCDATAQRLLHDVLRTPVTLVLDADALNLIAQHTDLRQLLFAREAALVLTPHPGEAARLLDCSTAAVQRDRVAAVRQLSKMFACAVVLKGADSLCATRDGRLFVNHTGNPGMSGPGMGDVLAGMIAAFIAQGLSTDDALLLAVHLHGAAGDALAQHIGMTATELTDQARILLNEWVSN